MKFPTARQFGEMLDRQERLERKLDELLAQLARGGSPANGPPRSVTKREAARILRVDRARTLEQLIRSNQLRAVPAPGGRGMRIPMEDIERMLRDGPREAPSAEGVSAPRRSRTAMSQISGAELRDRIRAIRIPRLD